ncbi:fasciclin domain-containing protein [Rhodotorula paludigena]|uniref:fasciclin domain-containing protein n=1 Tax=Rhodotorula paludigena TaxID=86838 RepID=UPI00316F2860
MLAKSAAALFAAAAGVAAQGQNGTAVAAGLLQALTDNNLTTLASLAQQNVAALLPLLTSEGNKTVFAPTNEAFSSLSEDASGNQTAVLELLSYHIYYGSFPSGDGDNETMMPTILRSTLNSSDVVNLPGGVGQVAVLTTNGSDSSNVTVLGATENVTSVATTQYQNFLVHVVPQLLTIPVSLSETAQAANLSSLTGALQQYAPDTIGQLESTAGITVFAPVNSAFAAAQEVISSLNDTAIANVLLNHVVTGEVFYSSDLEFDQSASDSSVISAGGTPLTFSMNDTGVFVMSGNASARVTRTNIPISNGVVHLIDAVLANAASSPDAAESAASSYSSVAATRTEQATGPVGTASGSAPSATGNMGGGGNGVGKTAFSASLAGGMLAAVGFALAA